MKEKELIVKSLESELKSSPNLKANLSHFAEDVQRKVCKKAGLADLKFHDLRKTFCSMLAQNGVSTAVTQRLLEHSSPTLTNKIYTNVDPVLRQSINKLPIEQWLEK